MITDKTSITELISYGIQTVPLNPSPLKHHSLRPEIPLCGATRILLACVRSIGPFPMYSIENQRPLALHSYAASRDAIDPKLMTQQERMALPRSANRWCCRENGLNPSLYLGSHACAVEGFPEFEGQQLIQELKEFATQPEFIFLMHGRNMIGHVGQSSGHTSRNALSTGESDAIWSAHHSRQLSNK
ncbi:MAG: hypothetical protein Ct9H300mP13_3910 [Gammaproteobacteria bacterium]|nr:MAG: hypothetical protein Ct9H300mP13_3910 [Gammaproteobacteria bacterium]